MNVMVPCAQLRILRCVYPVETFEGTAVPQCNSLRIEFLQMPSTSLMLKQKAFNMKRCRKKISPN